MALKCNIDSENTNIQVCGKTTEIAANVVELINRIYCSMKERDEDIAEGFKKLLMQGTEVMFMSPEELHEKVKTQAQAKEAVKECIEKAPKEIRKELMEMLKNAEE